MDKIVLSDSDILFLDEFIKDFISKYPDTELPMPLKAFEVILGNRLTAKYIREGNKLTVYVKFIGVNRLKAVGRIESSRMISIVDVNQSSPLPEDVLNKLLESLISIYGEIMMFMVYGGWACKSDDEPEQPTRTVAVHKKSTEKKKQKKSSNVVYILHRDEKGACVVPQGSHASPSYSFTVRGHLRHYKNGNTVWIAQYEKGGKQHKGKTYKVRRQSPLGGAAQ